MTSEEQTAQEFIDPLGATVVITDIDKALAESAQYSCFSGDAMNWKHGNSEMTNREYWIRFHQLLIEHVNFIGN